VRKTDVLVEHASLPESVSWPLYTIGKDLSSIIELRPNDLASPRIGVRLMISPKLDPNPVAQIAAIRFHANRKEDLSNVMVST
jgi:hypothetical protein